MLFWGLLLYIPLLIVWGFVLVDLARRSDIGILAKVLWAVSILVLPWVAAVVYVTIRPIGAARRTVP